MDIPINSTDTHAGASTEWGAFKFPLPLADWPAGRCTLGWHCWGYCCRPPAPWEVMSRHHRSPRPWRRWCSCCCRPPAGRRSALHPVPTDWTSCDVKKTKRNKPKKSQTVTFSVFEKLTTIKWSPTCCCWCLSVASSSCLVTGIQEGALAEAEESGRWSSEVTTAGWWGSCQEGTVGLAGLQLQQQETKTQARTLKFAYHTKACLVLHTLIL